MRPRLWIVLSWALSALAVLCFHPGALASPPIDPDLNGDGSPDLIWQDVRTGDVSVWYMSGAAWYGNWDYLARDLDTNWKIVGTADLNGDGQSDLLWQNAQTGDVAYWLMNGKTRIGNGYFAYGVPLEWKVVGANDINNDGSTDLVWQNTVSGDAVVWYMNGTQWTGSYDYLTLSLGWRIIGVAHVRGYNPADPSYQIIATQQIVASGQTYENIAILNMNGVTQANGFEFASVPIVWKPVALTDLTGDGRTDIVWQNAQTGDIGLWYNLPGTYPSSFDTKLLYSGVPAEWSLVPTH